MSEKITRSQIVQERMRGVQKGYNAEHDIMHGMSHLLDLAMKYGMEGEILKALAVLDAARDLDRHDARVQEEARQQAAYDIGFRGELDSLSPTDAVYAFGGNGEIQMTREFFEKHLKRAGIVDVLVTGKGSR